MSHSCLFFKRSLFPSHNAHYSLLKICFFIINSKIKPATLRFWLSSYSYSKNNNNCSKQIMPYYHPHTQSKIINDNQSDILIAVNNKYKMKSLLHCSSIHQNVNGTDRRKRQIFFLTTTNTKLLSTKDSPFHHNTCFDIGLTTLYLSL